MHLFRSGFDGRAPDGIGLGSEDGTCKSHGLGYFGDLRVFYAGTRTREAGEGVCKTAGRLGAQVVLGDSIEDEEAGVREAGTCKINGLAVFHRS